MFFFRSCSKRVEFFITNTESKLFEVFKLHQRMQVLYSFKYLIINIYIRYLYRVTVRKFLKLIAKREYLANIMNESYSTSNIQTSRSKPWTLNLIRIHKCTWNLIPQLARWCGNGFTAVIIFLNRLIEFCTQ